jgi:catechol 2,3-dioxygenase-like lactoylglutathione lyase family enzyme
MDDNIPASSSSSPLPTEANSKASNHVAVSVPDLDKAVKWYHEVLGFKILTEPMEGRADNSHMGTILKDIFGSSFNRLRFAHLSFGNQVGFEIFEFIDPKQEQRENNFEYWKTGFFHIAITDPNIEKLTKRIAENGGKQRSKVWQLIPDKPYKIVYCEDPFGNIIEIYTHNYEQVWSSK